MNFVDYALVERNGRALLAAAVFNSGVSDLC